MPDYTPWLHITGSLHSKQFPFEDLAGIESLVRSNTEILRSRLKPVGGVVFAFLQPLHQKPNRHLIELDMTDIQHISTQLGCQDIK